MNAFHYAFYTALGLVLVSLGVWRIARGTGSSLKFAGLLIGATILIVVALSLLGIVSTEGVEACLKERGRGRSKLLTCLAHIRMASSFMPESSHQNVRETETPRLVGVSNGATFIRRTTASARWTVLTRVMRASIPTPMPAPSPP
jgi:hypothetical protein